MFTLHNLILQIFKAHTAPAQKISSLRLHVTLHGDSFKYPHDIRRHVYGDGPEMLKLAGRAKMAALKETHFYKMPPGGSQVRDGYINDMH